MIKAVFFDLYGTLAGFSPSRYEIQSKACADFDIVVTKSGITKGYALADNYMSEQNSINPLRTRDAAGQKHFFTRYESLVLKGSGIDTTDELAWEIWNRVRELPYTLVCFDDVAPALSWLKDQAFTLGLISNMNRDGKEVIASLKLTPYLDFAVTSMEVGSEKPHSPIFLAALLKANVHTNQAMHVGDQVLSDVNGARASGIHPVLIDRDDIHNEIEMCPRIESMAELPDLLTYFQL